MSYCRFSSCNFMCDVYVYADCYGGWTTHVAGNRFIVSPIPEIPVWWLPRIGRYDHGTRRMIYPSQLHAALNKALIRIHCLSHSLHMWSVDLLPRVRINLPHAGSRFNDDTPQECAARLRSLSRIGYNVPRRVIDRLQQEEIKP